MLYLDEFRLPDADDEWRYFRHKNAEYAYDSIYPFQHFPKKQWERIVFDAVTIFYGGNGSGKSTMLNIIAQKLALPRKSSFNHSALFDDYVQLCKASTLRHLPDNSRIITSDDVFDYMFGVRDFNDGVDRRREDLFAEYQHYKNTPLRLHSMEDYEEFKQGLAARRSSTTQYVRQRVTNNIRTQSNGESALHYFQIQLKPRALYLLDEPENSLSAERQIQLAEFYMAAPGSRAVSWYWLPTRLFAGHPWGTHLRPGYGPRGNCALDSTAECAHLLRLFPAASVGI